jgi:hypothetical protein
MARLYLAGALDEAKQKALLSAASRSRTGGDRSTDGPDSPGQPARPRPGTPDHRWGFKPSAHASRNIPLTRVPCRPLLPRPSDKSERRAARSVVADYHHAQLGELVARVGEAVDRYRAGELDAFDVDHVLFQYSRAAKELWKFCNHLQVEVAAAMLREQPPHDWWERGAPRER